MEGEFHDALPLQAEIGAFRSEAKRRPGPVRIGLENLLLRLPGWRAGFSNVVLSVTGHFQKHHHGGDNFLNASWALGKTMGRNWRR